jgi:hypothetical protein
MMRKASTCLALLGIGFVGLVGLPAAASAAPTVSLKATAVPIPVNPAKKNSPNYPGTGDILGAPAAIEAEIKISGTEYGGYPAPLREVKTYLPAGTKVNTKGFAVCSVAVLEQKGAQGCPAKSYASAQGEANGVVSFGESRVHEKVSVQAFFTSGGGLVFYVDGVTPVDIEKEAIGRLTTAGGPFGPLLTAEVPLIESVPGALDASAEQIKVKVGAAFKKGKKLVSYGTMPKKCPKGGFPIKAELKFGAGEPSTWEEATATYKAPCPRHKK